MLGTVAAIEGTSCATGHAVKTLPELEIGILVSQEPIIGVALNNSDIRLCNVQILICQAPETHEASEESVKMGSSDSSVRMRIQFW